MRRSEPGTLPPASRVRQIDGVWHVGTSPWFECNRCGTVFDTHEYPACPFCLEWLSARRRQQFLEWLLEQDDADLTNH